MSRNVAPRFRSAFNKYRAQPTVVDGVRFASKKEAKRYGELRLLLKSGSIRMLALQPSYDLMVIGCNSRSYKIGEYRADFAYEELTETGGRWDLTVEDVKGFRTPLYKWKKRHFEAQYGLPITET